MKFACFLRMRQLEVKTTFSSSISKSLDPAMVNEAAAVKRHLCDALLQADFGKLLTNSTRGLNGGTRGELQLFPQGGGKGGRGCESALLRVIDDLGVDVLVRPEHGQSGALRGST